MKGTLRVRNWKHFQHYKDRCPPWIKLATDTFQNYEFSRLSDASKLLAICIWTLASRSRDGDVPNDFEYLKGVGCLGSMVKADHLKELISAGFLEVASNALADCTQSACSETETETEERQRRGEQSSPRPPERSSGTPIAGLEFPCDGKEQVWQLTREQLAEWQGLYPSVDVLGQCRNALGWVRAKPSRRKTFGGMPAFIVNWLGRTQDRGGSAGRVGGVEARTEEHRQMFEDGRAWAEGKR